MKAIPVNVNAMELYTALDERGAESYYTAKRRKYFLEREVTKKFEDSLRAYPGFSDENIPSGEVSRVCELGDISFTVKASPTTKRPGYEDVFNYAQEYLTELLRNAQDGTRMPGMVTIDGMPYVSTELVLGKMEGKKEEILQSGCKIEIAEVDIPSSLRNEGISTLAVPIGNGIAELNPAGAVLYLRARGLIEGYKAVISGFENELIALTGYGKDNIPEEPRDFWHQIGSHLFHVPNIPFRSPSYGKMVDRVSKRTERKAKTTGELVLLEMGREFPEMEKYRTRVRGGKPLVSVEGLLERMGEIKEECTQPNLKQRPIGHYPII